MFFFCLFELILFSQEMDTYQPDSIYRTANVKSRKLLRDTNFKQATILNFNRQGRISEFIMTDITGTWHEFKIEYKYKEDGTQIAEDYFYGSIAGEKTVFFYDSSGKVIKKSSTYEDNTIKKETVITYNPLKEVERNYNCEGKLIRESQSYFEAPNITKRFTGKDFNEEGKIISKWDYSYTNIYDEVGNLVKRELVHNKKAIQVIEYEYNNKNLLIEKTSSTIGFSPIKESYIYEFWE